MQLTQTQIQVIEQGVLALCTAGSTYIAANKTVLPAWTGYVGGFLTLTAASLNVALGQQGKTVAARFLSHRVEV